MNAQSPESPKEAARRLAEGALRAGYVPQSLHEYRDHEGCVLFYRIRLKHPATGEKWIRPMRQVNGIFDFGEPSFKDGKPLYNLNHIVGRPSEVVFVVEGEAAADVLMQRGVLATTSGGANSVEGTDWTVLRNRNVMIWPDNDEAGERYGSAVAATLAAHAANVELVDVLSLALPPKGDAVEWFLARPTADRATVMAMPRRPRPTISRRDVLHALGPQSSIDDVQDALEAYLPALHDLSGPARALERERVLEAVKRTKVTRPVSFVDTYLAESAPRSQGTPNTNVRLAAEPQDTATLHADLTQAIERYIAVPRAVAKAIALWVMHTWTLEHAQFTGRLVITSATKRCGKTLVLELLGLLTRKPLMSANITSSALFRIIERDLPTVLIDEADTFLTGNEELRGVLNAGFKRGGAVIRCVGDSHEPRTFACFAPVAIAAIGRVPDTIVDRAFVITMSRKSEATLLKRLDRQERNRLFDAFQPRLARWSADAEERLEFTAPTLPIELNDRQRDISEPLLAIAELCDPDTANELRRAIVEVCRVDCEQDDPGERALADVSQVFKDQVGTDHLSLKELVRAMLADEVAGWDAAINGRALTTASLSRLLQPFGLRAAQSRASARERGYYRRDVERLAQRYVGKARSSRGEIASGEGVTHLYTGPEKANEIDECHAVTPAIGQMETIETPDGQPQRVIDMVTKTLGGTLSSFRTI